MPMRNVIHRYARAVTLPATLTTRAAGTGAALTRTATVAGREYLIVPCVAVVGDIVWTPMGAEGPEFLPAYVLAANVEQWNGRPLLIDHPAALVPATDNPTILAAQAVGTVQAARFEDGRLKVEAWVDTARAESLSVASRAILAALRRGDPVEVSIGAMISARREHGTHNGRAYVAVWESITADHLAALSTGPGACSVDAGCGMPRAATTASPAAASVVTITNLHVVAAHQHPAAPPAITNRGVSPMPNVTIDAAELAALRRIAAREQEADAALRSALLPQLTPIATSRGGWTAQEIAAKPTDELLKLAQMLGVSTIGVLPGPDTWGLNARAAGQQEPPDPYGLDKGRRN